jgi:N4-gp56 family major capsid protein
MEPIANTEFGTYSQVAASFTNSNMGFTIAKLQGAVKYLVKKNAEPWPDGYFRAVISPDMIHLIQRDPEFLLWNQYGNAESMGYLNSEVGAVANVRLLASNRARIFGTMFSATAACSGYVTTICGIKALATIDHENDDILGDGADVAAKGIAPTIIMSKKNTATLADPLNQISAAIGYKLFTGSKILDTTRGVNMLQFYFSAADRY